MTHKYKKTSYRTMVLQMHRSIKRIKRRLSARKVLRGAKIASRMTLEGVLAAIVLMVAIQLIYPQSRTLPQTYIGGKNYGYQSEAQITASIGSLQKEKIEVVTGAQTLEYTPKDLGISFTGGRDAQQAISYNWRERLVPFSLLLERRDVPYYSFTVDQTKAQEFAASLKKYNKAPVDATVRLEGSKVVVTKQQDGYTYDVEQLATAIENLELTHGMKVTLQSKVAQPRITDRVAIEAANTLHQRLQKPITVQAAGKSVSADAALLASWTVLTADAQNEKLHIMYDREKIKQWLGGFAPQVYSPGTPQTVTILDGVASNSATAADGRALNIDATTDALIAAATASQPTVEGRLVPVVRAAQTIRSYTRSSQGLQALLNYWDETNAGSWGIVVKDFNGGISASLNPNRQFTSASVYKIYVAYVVYTKVDNGEFGMATPTGNGNNVSGCLDLMIVRSDNGCAHALGNMIGWDANDGMLHGKGFGSTSIASGRALTTAQDSTTYLTQLQNGSLLSASNREALLYKMGRNIYRYAIPAGSGGMHSANKLGAAGAFNHDVAIVYHPKGTYVLSAFSQGSNHARIRELARQVSAVMGQ